MPELPDKLRPEALLDAAIRFRWLLIVPFCMAMIVGMALALMLPEVYETSTTILVQAQKVPANYVRSLVSQDIDDRIRTIKQQILSWSNLEKIIDQYKLFNEPNQRRMLMEDKIEDLRKRIEVQVVRARGGADAFSIAFKGTDPDSIVKVANGLASYFINENLKVREAQAMGTSDFLEDELSTMRQRLLSLEEALKDYRRNNMGGLPEQLQTNLSILGRLQEELLEKQKALREAKAAMLGVQKQLEDLQNIPPPSAARAVGEPPAPGTAGGPADELESLKKQLEALKLRYTDQHPDVVRLRRKVAEVEDRIGAATAEAQTTRPLTPDPAPKPPPTSHLQSMHRAQIDQLNAEVTSQEAELAELRRQIEKYQKRVEDTPKREQELYALKRDYDNLKEAYNSLAERKLEADISVNMEKKQKGEQFQILDVAHRPERPVSPNIPLLFVGSVAVGIGAGGGLIFLLAFFDRTIRRTDELEELAGVPMMAAIPSIIQAADIRRRRWHMIANLCGVAVSVVLCLAFGVIAIKGVDRTVAFVGRLLGT